MAEHGTCPHPPPAAPAAPAAPTEPAPALSLACTQPGPQAWLGALDEPAWLVQAPALQVCAINAPALALLGLDATTALGTDAEQLLATPEDLAYWGEQRAQAESLPSPSGGLAALHSDTLLMRPSGELLPVTRRIHPLPAAAGQAPTHYLVRLSDLSGPQAEAAERERLLAELQATLEATADGLLVTGLDGGIRAFNQRFAEIWDLPQALQTQRQDGAVFDWMRAAVSDPETYNRRLGELAQANLPQASDLLRLHSGRLVERVARPQTSRGQVCGHVWSFRDRTEQITASQRIAQLSRHDSLTGLANRDHMGALLAEALRSARHEGTPLALLLLDLDRFKQINDGLGPEVGDRVLLETAGRLTARLRQGDAAARLGSDQFALLLHGAGRPAAEALALRLIDVVAQPMAVGSLPFTLTASVGVALFPEDGADADSLLRHAESAMQSAKRGGRACVRFHRPEQDANLHLRMRLDHAMRQALASHRFRLHYQPQVALASGRVVGAEALLRWRDPELGEVPPGQFIPVAEDTGFIVALGDWVLDQAVRQAAAWHTQGLVVPVSVNVSALQFAQTDFLQRVARCLREHGLPGELLELELTESVLVKDADDALARLSHLAALGVRLAIDDFGTGYSSLAYLKRFPIDRLKIDRSFVKGVPGGDSDVAIVRAIVQMAQALGLKVVAEGVETEPQRAFLQQLGCDDFQGWLYAPAMDASEFAERVRPPPSRPRLSLVLR